MKRQWLTKSIKNKFMRVGFKAIVTAYIAGLYLGWVGSVLLWKEDYAFGFVATGFLSIIVLLFFFSYIIIIFGIKMSKYKEGK